MQHIDTAHPAAVHRRKGSVMRKTLAACCLAVLIIAGLLGIKAYNLHRFHLEKETRFMMDTVVTIYAVGPKDKTSRAMDLAFDRMAEVNAKFSAFNPEGPVYAFNHQGTAISDPEILAVVRHALDVSRKTGGAFDITVSPLIELWGFYSGHTRLPDEAEIRACLDRVGYTYLHVKDGRLEKSRPDVRIDLGAIAKGYNIGQAVEVLKENGVTSALVDAGGDVYALGKKGRQSWHVGIKGPRETRILGYVDAENLAVVGSGDYERYFTLNEKRYHHIFDPRTGYPADGVSSITLIAPDPMAADAWATALFVLGPEKGLAAAEGMPGLEVLMVTTGGDKILSSGLRGQLKQLPKTP